MEASPWDPVLDLLVAHLDTLAILGAAVVKSCVHVQMEANLWAHVAILAAARLDIAAYLEAAAAKPCARVQMEVSLLDRVPQLPAKWDTRASLEPVAVMSRIVPMEVSQLVRAPRIHALSATLACQETAVATQTAEHPVQMEASRLVSVRPPAAVQWVTIAYLAVAVVRMTFNRECARMEVNRLDLAPAPRVVHLGIIACLAAAVDPPVRLQLSCAYSSCSSG